MSRHGRRRHRCAPGRRMMHAAAWHARRPTCLEGVRSWNTYLHGLSCKWRQQANEGRVSLQMCRLSCFVKCGAKAACVRLPQRGFGKCCTACSFFGCCNSYAEPSKPLQLPAPSEQPQAAYQEPTSQALRYSQPGESPRSSTLYLFNLRVGHPLLDQLSAVAATHGRGRCVGLNRVTGVPSAGLIQPLHLHFGCML